MSWSFIGSNNSSGQFELQYDGKHVMTLSMNADIGTFRINDFHSQRSFVVRKEGFLKNKLVLRNEYGVKVGQVLPDNRHSNGGTLEMGLDTYRYQWKGGDAPEITISDSASSLPSISFRLLLKTGRASAALLRKGMDNISSELLMAFCWYNQLKLRDSATQSKTLAAAI